MNGAFGSMVGKIFGLGLCNCSWLSASLFRYYATSIFTFTDDVFQGHSTFTGVHILYIFFFDMILNMHNVQDCNRKIFDGEKGGWWYPLYFFPPPASSTG